MNKMLIGLVNEWVMCSLLLIEFCDEKNYSDRYFLEGFATTTSFPFFNL